MEGKKLWLCNKKCRKPKCGLLLKEPLAITNTLTITITLTINMEITLFPYSSGLEISESFENEILVCK
jgi:hypothetical protein